MLRIYFCKWGRNMNYGLGLTLRLSIGVKETHTRASASNRDAI
jgi:hypothetical protein